VTDTSLGHRRGRTVATLVSPDGELLPHADVIVEQVRHEFGFGNIGFDLIGLAGGETGSDISAGASAPGDVFGGAGHEISAEAVEELASDWLELFNMATLPFYWAGFEPVRGHPDTARLLAAARWFAHRGVTIKGHPLLWHTLAPAWLMELPDAKAESVMRARVRREVTDFAGVVDLWDAINEPVILPVFTAEDNAVTRLSHSKGRTEMIRLAFDEARAANPAARLVINDFDLSADYEHVITECLEAGISIDAIGLQTHMHQGYRGADAVWEILERFARFGLPLQMTETTLVSGDLMPAHIVDLNDFAPASWPSTAEGEARQAEELVSHYRTVFSHPAVESLTYWGLTDTGSWLGAPGGLIRTDGTRKPSFDALRDLIKGEWWTAPVTLRSDDAGRVDIAGMAGTYRIRYRDAEAEITVAKGGDNHVRAALGR
jgi:endo-1,4-beta-xylanase